MFGEDADDDEGSIWDTGGIDLFGSSTSNGVTRVLSSSECTVEELMRQDEFIQETQGRNSRLLALLSSQEGMDTLLYYLTTPQHPRNEDRAFRFPYMASEALCCKVDELLDAVVGVGKEGQEGRDAALCALFSLPAPELRGSGGGGAPSHEDEVPRGTEDPFQLSQGIPRGTGFRSYLLGYWCKAVGVVCKTRPGPLLRFLDASPGIAAGLVPLLGNPAVASTLHASLLALPWAPPCALLATPHMTLAQGDPPHQGLPGLLLGALEAGLLACSSSGGGGGGGGGPGHALAVAEGAASVLCALLTTSRASAPHAKFAEDGYNERRIAAALAMKLANTPPTLPPSGDPVAAATAALIAGPSASDLKGALDSENFALDANFYSPAQSKEDSVHLRLLKVLRDDPHYVGRVVELLGLALGVVGGGREGAASFTSQSAASHVFRVVACLVEVLVEGWWEGVEECLRGGGSSSSSSSSSSSGGGGGGEVPSPPRTPLLITQLCAATTNGGNGGSMVASLSRHLLAECSRARGGSTVPGSSPPPPPPVVVSPARASAAPHPSSPTAPRLGLSGGFAVRLLVALTKCGWVECTQACSSAKAYTTLLSCMDSFPWHSVVHSAVAGGVITALSRVQTLWDRGGYGGGGGVVGVSAAAAASSSDVGGGSGSGGSSSGGVCAWASQSLSSSIESLVVGSDLPQWVSDKVGVMAWPPTLSSPKAPTLVGYGGHLLNITNALLSAFASNALAAVSPPSAHHVAGHTLFWGAVDGPIAVANVAHGVMLGGKLPPDVKASGVVGQNADAAPAPPSKGGKAGGEAGGGGGTGSGEEEEEEEEEEWGEDEERKEAEDRAKRLARLMKNSATTIGDYDDDGGVEDEDEEEEEEEKEEEERRRDKGKGTGEEKGGVGDSGHWDGFSGGVISTTPGTDSSSITPSFDDPFGEIDFGVVDATPAPPATPAPQATVASEDWGAF